MHLSKLIAYGWFPNNWRAETDMLIIDNLTLTRPWLVPSDILTILDILQIPESGILDGLTYLSHYSHSYLYWFLLWVNTNYTVINNLLSH